MEFLSPWNRREFMRFMGLSGLAIGGSSTFLSCQSQYNFKPLMPMNTDDVVLSPGLNYQILSKWQDPIGKGKTFGFNNDYTAFLPLSSDEAFLWVNHEYPDPLFVSNYTRGSVHTQAQVDLEKSSVGGSLVHIKRDQGRWRVITDSSLSHRIDGHTKIDITSPSPINGKDHCFGMVANCAGGVTPWGSILTCEENFDQFYGNRMADGSIQQGQYGWGEFDKQVPEQFGWVVEIDPKSGHAHKLTALGRFSHESATVTLSKDKRVVVYSGDDRADEHLYKFVSAKPYLGKPDKSLLSEGTLYVASLEKGEWLSLDRDKSSVLKKHFTSQLDVLIKARSASKLLGATPLDRPEDIEVQKSNQNVLVALTNNKRNDNYYGSILKIMEKDKDAGSLTFTHDTLIAGGVDSGVACPDNILFDKNENLWMANDISGSAIGRGPYKTFGNNGIFFIPTKGQNAGKVFQVASAPTNAEFTGLSFDQDSKNLFASVQHPGEKTKSLDKLKSNWPEGGQAIPRPAVITINGETLDYLLSGAV